MPAPTGYRHPYRVLKYTGSVGLEEVITFTRKEKLVGFRFFLAEVPTTPEAFSVIVIPGGNETFVATLYAANPEDIALDDTTSLADFHLTADDLLAFLYTNTDELDYLLEVILEPVE